jgi:hypothetical protein
VLALDGAPMPYIFVDGFLILLIRLRRSNLDFIIFSLKLEKALPLQIPLLLSFSIILFTILLTFILLFDVFCANTLIEPPCVGIFFALTIFKSVFSKSL